jgi:hypothetical protein
MRTKEAKHDETALTFTTIESVCLERVTGGAFSSAALSSSALTEVTTSVTNPPRFATQAPARSDKEVNE